jgi:hypothetical protein
VTNRETILARVIIVAYAGLMYAFIVGIIFRGGAR